MISSCYHLILYSCSRFLHISSSIDSNYLLLIFIVSHASFTPYLKICSYQKKCLAASFVIFVNIMRCFINMQCANVVLFRGTPCTLYFFFFKYCFKISYLCFCKLFNLIWQLYRIILYVFNSCVKISKFV